MANNWNANSGSWCPVRSLRGTPQSNNNMTETAQKNGTMLGRKSATISNYESPASSKQLPQTLHLQGKYVNPIAKNSCVGRGERTTPTTLQDRKKVQCSSFLLLHRTLKCLFPQDGLKDSTSLTNVMTLFLHFIHFHWRLHLLVQEAFDLI